MIQRDDLPSGLSQMIVCMITSREFRSNHPSRFSVKIGTPEGQQSGLLTDSIVMADNIATVATSEIDRSIGTLPMVDVDSAFRHTLAL